MTFIIDKGTDAEYLINSMGNLTEQFRANFKISLEIKENVEDIERITEYCALNLKVKLLTFNGFHSFSGKYSEFIRNLNTLALNSNQVHIKNLNTKYFTSEAYEDMNSLINQIEVYEADKTTDDILM